MSQAMESGQTPLPAGWRWARLGDVCVVTETRDPRREPDLTFKYVDITSVDNTTKKIVSAREILGKDAPSRARQVIRAGDVIASTTRPNLNAVALVAPELDNQICSTGFCILRAMDELDAQFLFAFAQTPEFVNELSESVKGALYPAVTDAQVRAVEMPLPPLPEQRRIAARLNAVMAEIARARAAAQAALDAANSLPAALLRAVFESEEAKGWERKRLGDMCDIRGGKRLPAGTDFAREKTPYPYIRVLDLQNGSVKTEDLKYVDEVIQEQIARYIIRREDVYISIAGTIGSAGIIPGELDGAQLTENAARLVIREPGTLYRDYLARFLQSPIGQAAIKVRTNLVGQPKLALERIATIEMLVPSSTEQKWIAVRLESQMEHALQLRASAQSQLDAINALPAAYLRRAFGGEL